ncbi:type IX secretion system periplasmic lipoprotein PorW/SprE [Sunxiuqinia sp. sy24]|uniref:type IX secretion system periplasmic lipoprotein PorW/SprE n=1 Tax=Sunxiuqinia sp. sy24 TaxID=3461495 RepID=UPI004045EE12
MSRSFLHSLFVALVLIIVGGCSTEKNTRLSRTYHNVTAHYNVYFNGRESLNAGVERINRSVEDDFTRLLPVFKSSDPGTGRIAQSDMEYAIMKASKLIKVHSITKKPKRRKNRSRAYIRMASKEEYNNWVDDSYILMGKAYFYMKNYMAAIENLSYVVRKFSEEDTKFEAYIWLIRSYTELERYNEALELIQNVDASVDFPKKYDEEFALAVADFHIRQNAFQDAIPQLKVAIDKTFWRKNKVRLKYILAQLYQESGQHELATETFREVAKMNPPYEMAFNARINAAGSFTGEGDVDKLKKELRKMLRDSKNYEFRDQIYYALGSIFMTEGNQPVAVDNYIRSAAASSVNVFQRALSCLTLADIYFEEKNYQDAQSYYDSAMVVIDETYPKYEQIVDRYNSLTRLTDNLYAVVREDSLQRLAAMSEAARNAKVSQWINAAREEEQRQRQLASEEMADRNFFRMNQSRMGLNRQQQGSGWYFYNPTTVAYGRVEFQQIWGERKLEDDWRRSNKNSASEFEMEQMDAQAAVDSSDLRIDDPMERAYYLQDVPLTDEALAESHQKIRDGLFNAGRIFKQDFDNYERAIQEFEELLRRYGSSSYQLTSYFELWNLYETVGNEERSNYYKNLIVANYPDSKYAKYLVNPNFFIELEARQDSVNNLYQQAFYNYQQGNYSAAEDYVEQIKRLDPDTLLLPKISFMETIAEGVQTDWTQFGKMLNQHIQTYPASGTVALAKQVLKLIEDSTLADYQKLVEIGYLNDQIENDELLPENQADQDEFGGKFSYDDELLHYFVIAFPRSADVDLNRLKFDIANYNIDHYTRMDFDMETENLNNETTLVVVRALPDKEQSLIYFRSIIREREVFQSLGDIQYVNFVASSYNYREIKSDKNYLEYLKYFVKNYSRFVTNDFPADSLEDPEELLARLRADEERLEERGSFVVVKADETKGLFDRQNEASHYFVIAVNDPSFDLRALEPGFNRYNRLQAAALNLTVEQQKFGDYQLMVVKSLDNAQEAMNYFSKVVANRSLYESLEMRAYRNFIITDSNLAKMKKESTIADYVEFFRDYYISGAFKPGSAQGTSPNAVSKPETSVVAPTPVQPEKPAYEGPFNTTVEGKQLFILMIPKTGVDQAQIQEAIANHNQQNFSTMNLLVEAADFDSDNLVLKVSGINDKESGMNYLRSLVQNQQVYQPLSTVSYRNFVITPENYDTLMSQKAMAPYLEFYKAYYLTR